MTGDKILGCSKLGSHGPSQILMDFPLPTLHLAPLTKTSLPLRILRQAYEPLGESGASINEQFGKNLLLKTLCKSESLLCRRHQACLANKA